VPVVAYGALVPPSLLDLPRHGWVNLHFSLLPAWRGAAPVQHALLHGDEVTGASTFRLEQGLDTGPVFGVVTERVRPADTSGDLLERLAVAGAELLVRTLDALEAGVVQGVPQPTEGVSLAPKLTPTRQPRVDWTAPASRSTARARLHARPGAWTTLRASASSSARHAVTDAAARPASSPTPGRHRPTRRAARRGRPRAGARCPPPTGCAACASSRRALA
jgi:methionyl-tRNA formyltransferase